MGYAEDIVDDDEFLLFYDFMVKKIPIFYTLPNHRLIFKIWKTLNV